MVTNMKNAKGMVFKYGDNVDTDVIIPARYLNSSDPAELATHCMEDIDKDFVNKVKAGDIITDVDFRHACGDEKYDLVLANILADVIIPLSGVIKDNMKPGALFVSSGIINTKEDDVREALLANGFEILEVTHSGDWVAFTARK